MVLGRSLRPESTVFFLCDFQECFKTAVQSYGCVLEVVRRLVEGGKLLQVPLIVTEQYPKGLGHTAPSLDIGHAVQKVEKDIYVLRLDILYFRQTPVKSVVLFGLETALDCLGNGYEVYVIADATTSRSQTDRLLAFERLKQAGCIITTYEAVLMQLIRGKDHEQFKAISNLIKIQPLDTGLTPKL